LDSLFHPPNPTRSPLFPCLPAVRFPSLSYHSRSRCFASEVGCFPSSLFFLFISYPLRPRRNFPLSRSGGMLAFPPLWKSKRNPPMSCKNAILSSGQTSSPPFSATEAIFFFSFRPRPLLAPDRPSAFFPRRPRHCLFPHNDRRLPPPTQPETLFLSPEESTSSSPFPFPQ